MPDELVKASSVSFPTIGGWQSLPGWWTMSGLRQRFDP